MLSGCILFKNYIKPQPLGLGVGLFAVVSYLKTTSNHNDTLSANSPKGLYLI